MKTFNLLSFAAIALVLTACGSQVSQSGITTSSGSNASSSSSSTNNASSTGNIYNLPNAKISTVTLSGTVGPYPTVSFQTATSRTLKVKVTAQSAPHLTIPGYEGWVFPYGCMQLTVSVNGGQPQTTQVLHVSNVDDSLCANAPTEQVLDFTNDMTGNGHATITVSDPQYDNCRNQWPLQFGGQYNCQMSAVWSNHLVKATLQTQVDGTWMDP